MASNAAGSSGANFASIDTEALIESSFRRLLAAVESERERIRAMWNQIEQERAVSEHGLAQYTQDTNEWCSREREKVDMAYQQLEEATVRMRVMHPNDQEDILDINCSGKNLKVPKAVMCQLEESYLNVMFSAEFEQAIPRDPMGRLYLDFNPVCFELMVKYLTARSKDPRAPLPEVPPEQQRHMEVLAHSLNVKQFLRPNVLPRKHSTSLLIRGAQITATHKGWQVIAAEHPLSQARDSYFEVEVLKNPDPKGGLAIGVVGHRPEGSEVHRITFDDGVLYNSHNGLVGKAFAGEDVQRGITLVEGCTFGIKFRVGERAVVFYLNGHGIGTAMLKRELQHQLNALYPVIGMYVTEQQVEVDFSGKMKHSV